MKCLCLSLVAVAFALGACERHSWEDVEDEDGIVTEKGTKRLFAEHGHEEGDNADHDADHEDHGEGAGQENHGEGNAPVAHDHDGDGQADH